MTASKIADRGALSDEEFALPDERRYPIPDEEHAKLALAQCKGTPEEDKVRAAVLKKYPQLKAYAEEVLDNDIGSPEESTDSKGKSWGDLNVLYYEAALSSVEGALQRRGMNTTGTEDETLRRLADLEADFKAVKKIPDRGKLDDSVFAVPETRSYPIPDEEHAKLALGRCKGKPEEDKVRAAVLKKYPQLKEYAKQVLD